MALQARVRTFLSSPFLPALFLVGLGVSLVVHVTHILEWLPFILVFVWFWWIWLILPEEIFDKSNRGAKRQHWPSRLLFGLARFGLILLIVWYVLFQLPLPLPLPGWIIYIALIETVGEATVFVIYLTRDMVKVPAGLRAAQTGQEKLFVLLQGTRRLQFVLGAGVICVAFFLALGNVQAAALDQNSNYYRIPFPLFPWAFVPFELSQLPLLVCGVALVFSRVPIFVFGTYVNRRRFQAERQRGGLLSGKFFVFYTVSLLAGYAVSTTVARHESLQTMLWFYALCVFIGLAWLMFERFWSFDPDYNPQFKRRRQKKR